MNIQNVVSKGRSFVATKYMAALVLLVPAVSFAQAIDVSGTVTEIGTAKAAALLIGAAVLGVAIGIMLYKWVRRAL